MNVLVDCLKEIRQYADLTKGINEGSESIGVFGILQEAKGHLLYSLANETEKPMLIICSDEYKAGEIYDDLLLLGYERAGLFLSRPLMLYDVQASSLQRTAERIKVLTRLIRNEIDIVVASIDAVFDLTIDRETFINHTISLNLQTVIEQSELTKKLSESAYERVVQVEGPGQFAVRGGIIDVFAPGDKNPVRIEFFSDEVDQMRTFDILTQRSLEMINEFVIPPAREILISDNFRESLIKDIEHDVKATVKKLPEMEERILEKFTPLIESLRQKNHIANRDLIIPYIRNIADADIFEYLPDETLIVFDEPDRTDERVENFMSENFEHYEDMLKSGELLLKHSSIYKEYDEIKADCSRYQLMYIKGLTSYGKRRKYDLLCNFDLRSSTSYMGNMEVLKDDMKFYLQQDYKVLILAGNEERAKRILSLMESISVNAHYGDSVDVKIKEGDVLVLPLSIKTGFIYAVNKFVLMSDSQILKVGRNRKKVAKKANRTLSFSDLRTGDFVVHEVHGIGKYVGTESLEVQGVTRDYLRIEYKGGDRLFIPTDQLSLIHKYVGNDGKSPKINKLNSSEWKNQKKKAKSAVMDMAEDLLKLYAKREKLTGYQFGPDSEWQFQFEDLFPYEETEGQSQSSYEIKRDMERPRIMDRLLCADVGYGKTEVALRAAFKAIMEGKQVAMLVPTTLLALQHYNTMVDRFKEFPINVQMLSRFRTKKEQSKTVDDIRKGLCDIVVGTHRLLSDDVKFKDLGLIIVDEEQRFGVRHKEKLKFLKENVDTLTLSATPIPRTLQMSLAGIRDMSVIETPPEERLPVQTYVLEYSDRLVRDSVLREISRNGQVYFLYNKVQSIEGMTERLQELVPEAKFGIAHGQMSETQLEKAMLSFYEHEIDVLVCSTIIETGIDLSNVNTIVIYDADNFGLSQLYQLRGRVGRSTRMAYCYLCYQKDKVLTEIAEKRLLAIKEFTEFGSGFKIAMRDLELRGAGNLLGTEQHGQLASIGYDLYVKYLKNSVDELRGVKIEEDLEASVDILVDAYIPKSYIESEEERLDMYKRIAAIEGAEDYDEIYDELLDRFGEPGTEIMNLIDISLIRYLAGRNKIKTVSEANGIIRMDFLEGERLKINTINELTELFKKRIDFVLTGKDAVILKSGAKKLEDVKSVLMHIDRMNKSDLTINKN